MNINKTTSTFPTLFQNKSWGNFIKIRFIFVSIPSELQKPVLYNKLISNTAKQNSYD